MSLSAGQRVGPYEILSRLGTGGMGDVFLARDSRLDRKVAVKVLLERLDGSPDLRKRFEREARAVSALNHPHICTLYDIGHQDGFDYLVMEYLEGETLADRVVKSALPLAQALRYGAEIADALDFAHRRGIVHRDLKPANIMVTSAGIKLLDFGLAKLLRAMPESENLSAVSTEARNLTDERTVLGTLQYMSPEQLEGKEVDARADLFSLGAVLYEMVTGKKAFYGESTASLVAAILERDPPPVSHHRALAPRALDHVITRCLAKDPEERWQTARDVKNELRWIAQEGERSEAAAMPAGRRGWRALVRTLGAYAAAGIFAGTAVWLALRPDPAQRPSVRSPTTRVVLPLSEPYSGKVAVSPGGSNLVYGSSPLRLRALDGFDDRPIPGTERGGAGTRCSSHPMASGSSSPPAAS